MEEATEQFRCNFGLNPIYRAQVLSGALRCTGVDQEGEARVIELTNHRFFIATLFLPQLSSSPERSHPLITAYVRAAVAFRDSRNGDTPQGKGTT